MPLKKITYLFKPIAMCEKCRQNEKPYKILLEWKNSVFTGLVEGSESDIAKGLGTIFEKDDRILQMFKISLESSELKPDDETMLNFKDCILRIDSDSVKMKTELRGTLYDVGGMLGVFIYRDPEFKKAVAYSIDAFEAFKDFKKSFPVNELITGLTKRIEELDKSGTLEKIMDMMDKGLKPSDIFKMMKNAKCESNADVNKKGMEDIIKNFKNGEN